MYKTFSQLTHLKTLFIYYSIYNTAMQGKKRIFLCCIKHSAIYDNKHELLISNWKKVSETKNKKQIVQIKLEFLSFMTHMNSKQVKLKLNKSNVKYQRKIVSILRSYWTVKMKTCYYWLKLLGVQVLFKIKYRSFNVTADKWFKVVFIQ